MRNSDSRINQGLVLLVAASLVVFATAVILRVGIEATPYETADTTGRTMGFNDVFSREHYAIAAGNFRPAQLLATEYIYEWILLAAHLVGGWLLVSCGPVCSRATRWYFAGQALVFPLGVPSLLLLPAVVGDCLSGSLDRENFVDIPFILVVSQSVWIATSMIVAFTLRGHGLFHINQRAAPAIRIQNQGC